MRSFNAREEAEANWLAGALLLPREALLNAHREGLSQDDLCKTYRISKKMLSWRLTATGVAAQEKRLDNLREKRKGGGLTAPLA